MTVFYRYYSRENLLVAKFYEHWTTGAGKKGKLKLLLTDG